MKELKLVHRGEADLIRFHKTSYRADQGPCGGCQELGPQHEDPLYLFCRTGRRCTGCALLPPSAKVTNCHCRKGGCVRTEPEPPAAAVPNVAVALQVGDLVRLAGEAWEAEMLRFDPFFCQMFCESLYQCSLPGKTAGD